MTEESCECNDPIPINWGTAAHVMAMILCQKHPKLLEEKLYNEVRVQTGRLLNNIICNYNDNFSSDDYPVSGS